LVALRCLESDSKLVLWWRLALNKSTGWWCSWSEWDKPGCCGWIQQQTNSSLCVMTQAFISSSNRIGYKWYETGRIRLSKFECKMNESNSEGGEGEKKVKIPA
jgi:hypothetical protein